MRKMGIEIFENYNCDNQLSLFQKEKSNDWKWSFKDYPKEKNGLKVFSCFSCGGGSTMGYKLAVIHKLNKYKFEKGAK